MLGLLFTALLAAAPFDVTATTLDEHIYDGELQAITADTLVVKSGVKEISLPLSKLLSIVPRKRSTSGADFPAIRATESSLWVDLTDGSRLPINAFAVRAGKAHVTILGGQELELPLSNVRRVQLLPHDDKDKIVSGLWNDLSSVKLKGDAVVVRKGGGGKAVVLDYLEGAVGDVTDGTIAFTIDGDTIEINRNKVKVEGILFYRPSVEPLPHCRINDRIGATWNAKSFSVDGEKLKLVTVNGIEQTLPLAHVKELDFSLGKILFLSDLEPVKADWQPYLSTANLSAGARQLFGLRRDRSFSGKLLALGDARFRKGLAVHSRSDVAYRLPGEFTRFVAIAGIDPAQRSRGNIRLEIRGDDRVLLDEAIAGGDAPRTLELDMTGVGRLTILVDYGEGLDIGDQLILGNARLIR